MPLPEALQDNHSAAISYITRADSVSVKNYCQNARASLDNAVYYVVPAPAIDQAVRDAKARIDTFEAALAGQWVPARMDAAQLARQDALTALKHLEGVLANARPNAMAKALGMDWF